MNLFDGSVGIGTLLLLGVCLLIALGFEFVNGFHDTANAVATVIYTRSLRPTVAVIWSGLMNFTGVLVGGSAVAFSIVHLLPVDLLINIGQSAGILMVLSLLISAIVWNLGTWYFGLPSSSSHALIGSILGVGIASSIFSGRGFGSGVNWGKAQEVGISLLVSPLIGFTVAALLLLLMKALIKDKKLYEEPDGENPPPLWIRGILSLTCTLVSFFHGSNDGQKGVGLIMLILIGLLPTQFAVNSKFKSDDVQKTTASIQRLENLVSRSVGSEPAINQSLEAIRSTIDGHKTLRELPDLERRALRDRVLRIGDALGKWEKINGSSLTPNEHEAFKKDRAQIVTITDFVASWVPAAVAIALGLGTTIGWKRIVVTVGEKIGKSHLTYAQGAAAELVAAATIYGFDKIGLPVSTTHILSSGVAGTMAANRSGLNPKTVRNIALAWVFTLPITMLLAGSIFALTAGRLLHNSPPQPAPQQSGAPRPYVPIAQ